MRIPAILLLSMLLACGPSSSAETASTSGGESGHHGHHGEHHEEHGDHHAALPAEVNALHDELAPVWHQEPGPGRTAAGCEHAASFRAHAATIQGIGAPDGASAEVWAAATASLASSAETLASECAASSANAEAAFDAFHTAFHGVMDASHAH
jgi:hypothetical protein